MPTTAGEETVATLCGDPEVPDLSNAQILALHQVGDSVQEGIDVANAAGIDIRTTLAILLMRLVSANRAIVAGGAPLKGVTYKGAAIGTGYANGTTTELDEMAVIAANNLYVAMDHNLRMQVRYKNPTQLQQFRLTAAAAASHTRARE